MSSSKESMLSIRSPRTSATALAICGTVVAGACAVSAVYSAAGAEVTGEAQPARSAVAAKREARVVMLFKSVFLWCGLAKGAMCVRFIFEQPCS